MELGRVAAFERASLPNSVQLCDLSITLRLQLSLSRKFASLLVLLKLREFFVDHRGGILTAARFLRTIGWTIGKPVRQNECDISQRLLEGSPLPWGHFTENCVHRICTEIWGELG